MKIINKIFGDKKGNTVIYILLAIGIIMIAAGSTFSSPKEAEPKEKVETIEKEKPLEEKLEEILSEIKGAGKVSVMVIEDNDGKRNFSYDTNGKEKKTVILNKQGGEEALVSETITPRIRGVLIVSDGGGEARVKADLIEGTQTALGIAPHKIVVYERNDKE